MDDPPKASGCGLSVRTEWNYDTDDDDGLPARSQSLPKWFAARPVRYRRPDVVMPDCKHSSMAIIYNSPFPCMRCGRVPLCGMLYRCVVDREPLIIDASDSEIPVTYDDIGRKFTEEMSLGKFGPDVRSEALSVMTEKSLEQRKSYTPEQVYTLITQRENVHKTIADEREHLGLTDGFPARYNYPHDDQPWLPRRDFECQYKACMTCHSIGRQKSWVSLDGVLNGDILPTVATGFSSSPTRRRPVGDAGLIKDLGCSAIPFPRIDPEPSPGPNDPASSTNNIGVSSTRRSQSYNRGSLPPLSSRPPIPQRSSSLAAIPREMADDVEETVRTEVCYPGHILACWIPLPEVDGDEQSQLSEEYNLVPGEPQGDTVQLSERPRTMSDGVALAEEALDQGTNDLETAISLMDRPV
ncbi:hypothetical protein B0J18DRAFT_201632 [Chaetomium sp. MPI-SDFR-AT-0129]|nr:hypothetical protein B0J18DRAFT_201632 [Chaetomium sp. MPI-SDFR-AT-0129]